MQPITAPRSVTITVTDNTNTSTPPPTTTTKSGDATLKSITIGGKTYSGSSLKDTITYTAGATVNSIKISAVENNSKATVSGTGTKTLVQGQTNPFQINVTAENGTKKTYTVNIIRLAEESTVPNIIDEPTQNPEETKLMLTSLIIKDVELNPEFDSDIYNYVTNVQNIKNLEIDATANKPDAQISIEGATDLKEGDNIIKITVTLGEEKIEYIIDVYNTIQEEILGTTQDENNDNKNIIAGNNSKKFLLVGLTCLIGIIAIRYIILSYKLSRELEGDLDDIILDEDEEDNLEVKNQNLVTQSGKTGRHF